jgi:hypothetical protein
MLVVLNLAMGGFAFAQDSAGQKTTYTISGSVGLSGVKMMGLPGNPISDEQGRYTITVERGWTGDVFPSKEGYKFEPAGRPYRKVVGDQVGHDYTPSLITYTISVVSAWLGS